MSITDAPRSLSLKFFSSGVLEEVVQVAGEGQAVLPVDGQELLAFEPVFCLPSVIPSSS